MPRRKKEIIIGTKRLYELFLDKKKLNCRLPKGLNAAKLIRRGVPSYKIDNKVHFLWSEVQEFIDARHNSTRLA
jgi:hypothetical protein